MVEEEPSRESSQYKHDQVLEVLKKFVEKGYTSPDDLPLSDSEVINANRILDLWSKQAERLAQEDTKPGAMLEFQLTRSTIYVDTGFLDRDYLDEVANDWLVQDLQIAEDQGQKEIAAKIRAKIDQINSKLAH